MFETYGIVTYNPRRNVKSDWWLTLELPEFYEIARYYRWFIDKEWWKADSRNRKRAYSKPPHSYHISLIRGEKPRKNIHHWGKWRAGEKIPVRYDDFIRQTSFERDGKDHFWFFKTDSEYAEFRKHYGLAWQRNGIEFTGHVTICRSF